MVYNDLKIRPYHFLLPLFLSLAIVCFLYQQDALSANGYVQIQKNCFLFINSKLSQFPTIIYNLTQFGDALVILSLLTVLLVSAPKMWGNLLSASIVSTLISNLLKKTFAIARPAAMFDKHSFVITGEILNGHNSLPSGHSITIFTTLTVLFFAFMPKKASYKVALVFGAIILGFCLAFTRVGVGAHYPFDVVIGGITGYTAAIVGIFINQKYKIWDWIGLKKYYPILIISLLGCALALLFKINHQNLLVYNLALVSLVIALYKIIKVYVQK